MGLFDSIAGQVAGQVLGGLSGAGAAGQGSPLAAVQALLGQQEGGLAGLVAAFQQQGLGELVQSWIGSGANLPISAEQILAVLGNDKVQAFAQQLGFSLPEAAQQLATLLPQVIDQLTPGGRLPEAGGLGDLLGGALGQLGR